MPPFKECLFCFVCFMYCAPYMHVLYIYSIVLPCQPLTLPLPYGQNTGELKQDWHEDIYWTEGRYISELTWYGIQFGSLGVILTKGQQDC